ncbi:MAG: hypothetical protein MI757_22105 [Pirellulales bacterium]|nr:hypothetical protein [Pirellulales bacterium]
MTAEANADNPTILLLVDETSAMQEAVRDGKKSRSEAVATAVNTCLKQLAAQESCNVGLLALAGDDAPQIETRWCGEFAGQLAVATDEYLERPLTVEERTRRIPDASGFGVAKEETVEFPVWYRPGEAGSAIEGSASELGLFGDSRTLLVHVTSSSESAETARELVAKFVPDSVACLHIEIGSSSGAPAICFPANRDYLPEGDATAWFERTARLGPATLEALRTRGLAVNNGARGLVLQGGLKELLDALAAARAWVTDTEAVAEPEQEASSAPTVVSAASTLPTPPPPGSTPSAESDEESPAPAAPETLTPPPEIEVSEPPVEAAREAEPAQAFEESEEVSPAVESISPPVTPEPVPAQPEAVVVPSQPPPEPVAPPPEPPQVPVADSPPAEESERETVAAPSTPAAQPEPEPSPPVRRGLMMIVLDRSLQDPVAPPTDDVFTKIKHQANDLLAEIARTADGWLDVGLVTYGRMSAGPVEVSTRFFGGLTDHSIVTDRQLTAGVIRTESYEEELPNGIGGIITRTRERPMYVELPPTEQASCVEAFQAVAPLVGGWCSRNRGECAAPLIVHMTRGAMNQRDLRAGLKKLKSVRSTGGPPLIHHVIITEQAGPAAAYPVDCGETGPSELRFFCQLSSPHVAAEYLAERHRQIRPDSHGIVVNGTFDLAVQGFRHTLCAES